MKRLPSLNVVEQIICVFNLCSRPFLRANFYFFICTLQDCTRKPRGRHFVIKDTLLRYSLSITEQIVSSVAN